MSEGLNELHLFAGAGGGILGGILLGHTCVCAVEIEPYCRKVLLQRQRDGFLPPFPIWDDVRTFDGTPWRGLVDVVCGGFPCQDISVAGRGAGIGGERSGLWKEFARIIGEVRPRYVLVENSPMLASRGLGTVLGDLASMGFDAEWCVLGAVHVGHPHERKRLFILARERERERQTVLAHTNSLHEQGNEHERFDAQEWQEQGKRQAGSRGLVCGDVCYTAGIRLSGQGEPWFASDPAQIEVGQADQLERERIRKVWGVESAVGRVAHGVAHRVDRLKAIGNGQVPSVVALAWRTLEERL